MYDFNLINHTSVQDIYALYTGTAEPITGGSPSDSASPSTTYQENTATNASTHPIIQGRGTNPSSNSLSIFTEHFNLLLLHRGQIVLHKFITLLKLHLQNDYSPIYHSGKSSLIIKRMINNFKDFIFLTPAYRLW